MNVALTPHQRTLSLPQRLKITTEQNAENKWPCVVHFQVVCNGTLVPKTQDSMRSGLERFEEPEDQKVGWQIISPGHVQEATSMKSQQHGCRDKTWTSMTATGMLTWRGEPSKGLNSRQRTAGNYRILRVREGTFPQREPPSSLSNTSGQALEWYTHKEHYVDWTVNI